MLGPPRSARLRLVNGGVLDRFPDPVVHIAHLGGGISFLLGRIRGHQAKRFWCTAGDPRHSQLPERSFDYYVRERLAFDTAGFCGDAASVRLAVIELSADRIVFGSHYPQEIREPRDRERIRRRHSHADGERMLSRNVDLLLG